MWVPSEACSACTQAGMDSFQTEQSESFKLISDKLHVVRYAQGAAYGYLSSDKICIPTLKQNNWGTNPEFILKEDQNNQSDVLKAQILSGTDQ